MIREGEIEGEGEEEVVEERYRILIFKSFLFPFFIFRVH